MQLSDRTQQWEFSIDSRSVGTFRTKGLDVSEWSKNSSAARGCATVRVLTTAVVLSAGPGARSLLKMPPSTSTVVDDSVLQSGV